MKGWFLWQNQFDVLKVLHVAKFSEIWSRYTTQDNVSDHQLEITFQHSNFVRKALSICSKRQHLPAICKHKFPNFFLDSTTTEKIWIKNYPTRTALQKLRAISDLFSFFDTLCI